jgi:hypothetical protein
MLIPFSKAIDMKYGDYILKWWRLKECHLRTWVHPLRDAYIIKGLMYQPFHFVFNGAGFRNELNTKWEDGFNIPNVILYAPILRREILPTELVLDPDIEDKTELVKKSKWLRSALETLEIDYTMGYSGRRSFHFHVIVDPAIELPADLPEGFNIKLFKEAIFNLIGYCAGFDGLDIGTAGFKGKRHMVREFFSINEKTRAFKIPVEEIEVKVVKFPKPVEIRDWQGYVIWTPSRDQIKEILEEVERIIADRQRSKKRLELFWKTKPRKKRTLGSRWRLERIQKYAEALKKYGKLMADPEIARRHENEHMARVHLILLMIEEEFTDEQIHAVFKHAEDYKENKTQYYIDYNRKWLGRKKMRGDFL